MSSSATEDIWFKDPNNDILTSDNDGLYSSTDGGKTWNPIPNTADNAAFNIQLVDNLNGFIQGE